MRATRREFVRGVGLTGAMAAAAVVAPRTGRALQFGDQNGVFGVMECAQGTKTVAFRTVAGTYREAAFPDWKEGDCELRGATIRLKGDGSGVFQAQVCTHFTHSKDVWHFYVQLATTAAAGERYLEAFRWDGPKMSEQDHPLFHNWTVNFKFEWQQVFGQPSLYARASSCC